MSFVIDPHDVTYRYVDHFVFIPLTSYAVKHYNDHKGMILFFRIEGSIRDQINVVYNANLLI